MIVIIAILLTISFTILSAVIDSEHLKDSDYIEDHRSRWVLRLIFFIAMGLAKWQHGIGSALLFATLFDQTLNYFMAKKIWYLGTVAKWDLFFSKRLRLYIVVKILCLLLSLFLFIY